MFNLKVILNCCRWGKIHYSQEIFAETLKSRGARKLMRNPMASQAKW